MALEAVVDASVFLSLLIPEELSANAVRFFASGPIVYVPYHCELEVMHVLLKKVRQKLIPRETAVNLFRIFDEMPKQIEGGCWDGRATLDWYLDVEISPFDMQYYSLSSSLNLPLVSADQRLVSLGATPLSSF